MRSKIDVDPHTAQVTIATDPAPTRLRGIPLDVRVIDIIVDRPSFTFNATNCKAMSIAATIGSAQGATASASSRFQAVNCASLRFKPGFSASTQAKTSRKNGASLTVKLAYPKGSFGSQANIARVHVELPKVLPSRLSTLNHACLDSVFNQNPASCPAQSRVGYAKAITPVLPVPLEGPAYFVSHGGQKFPELIIVLQGDGVTVDLQGETFISKAGITSSTFAHVPDVPVGTFELTLPQGPYSALAANGNLCSRVVRVRRHVHGKLQTLLRRAPVKLIMPTIFTAQNGAVLRQNTKIGVEGCAKQKAKHRRKGKHPKKK